MFKRRVFCIEFMIGKIVLYVVFLKNKVFGLFFNKIEILSLLFLYC